MAVDYLILTAVQSECEPFLEKHHKNNSYKTTHGLLVHKLEIANKKIAICVSGIGTSFSAIVTGSLCSELNPKAIFFCGTCGGIDPKLKIGDIIIASSAFEAEIQNMNTAFAGTPFEDGLTHPSKQQIPALKYNADATLLEHAKKIMPANKNIYFGPLASSNQFPSPADLFAELKKQKTLAIDMETSAIYQAGWLLNTPCLAVRCVSNCLDNKGNDPDIHSAKAEDAAKIAAAVLIELIENLP